MACGICFVALLMIVGSDAKGSPSESAFTPIFDGQTLDGWVVEGTRQYEMDGKTIPVWTAREGMIVCDGSGFGFLRLDRSYRDFVFRIEFKMAPKCNSGIGIRTVPFTGPRTTRPSFASYEIQLFDDANSPPSTHGTGSLYRYLAPTSNPIRPAGEWNQVEIRCEGPRIRVTLNGTVIQDIDQTQHASLKEKPLEGSICLQNHGGDIEFRNPRVHELTQINAVGKR